MWDSKVGKKIRALTLTFAMAAAPLGAATARRSPAPVKAYAPPSSSIVIDADTGKVLEENSPDAIRYPASMTKIMAFTFIFDGLRDGSLTLQTKIPISARAAKMGASNLNLKAGETMTVGDAISAMAVHSANDVAVAVAEKLGGTEDQFAAMMTARARTLGMDHTTYVNASGWPDKRQLTTARDMSILCEHLIKDYPEFYHYFSQPDFVWHGHIYPNHNRLMTGYRAGNVVIKPYPGMDGIKTGLTDWSGSNLAASAVHGKRRLIAVIFGGPNAVGRDQMMTALLDQAFAEAAAQDAAAAKLAKQQAAKPVPAQPVPAPPAADHVAADWWLSPELRSF